MSPYLLVQLIDCQRVCRSRCLSDIALVGDEPRPMTNPGILQMRTEPRSTFAKVMYVPRKSRHPGSAVAILFAAELFSVAHLGENASTVVTAQFERQQNT